MAVMTSILSASGDQKWADRPEMLAFNALTVSIKGRKIDWGFAEGYETVCAKAPQSLAPLGDTEELTLIPYGCAKLRMTELPEI